MNTSTRELATSAGTPLSGDPHHPAADRAQASATDSRTGFPIDKRALPDMTPEQWERWEQEICGPW